MEIERKYLIESVPEQLDQYENHRIEQGYLCTDPVVRIRRQDDDYILTYKSSGLMAREEYNLPLNKEAYTHLKPKTDGHFIEKTRYLIPLTDTLTIELDVFDGEFAPLILAEVEFSSEEEANQFVPPDWFGTDVTFDGHYHNSYLSQHGLSHKS
ncbi:MAG: CYTH domain-containing protein [Lachnospiraceae bacterium]